MLLSQPLSQPAYEYVRATFPLVTFRLYNPGHLIWIQNPDDLLSDDLLQVVAGSCWDCKRFCCATSRTSCHCNPSRLGGSSKCRGRVRVVVSPIALRESIFGPGGSCVLVFSPLGWSFRGLCSCCWHGLPPWKDFLQGRADSSSCQDTGRIPDLYFSMACSPCPGGAHRLLLGCHQLHAIHSALNAGAFFWLFEAP
eukprot:symbB.v1.2.035866.t1/scaffold4931.1/size32735/3